MIIERKPKSSLVEEIMNFKKEDKQEIVEEVKTEEVKEEIKVEENQPVVEEVVKEEVLEEKKETEVKPSEAILDVELKEATKASNVIECADRKAVAEERAKLKEQHIKHKVSKVDGKYIIECFESVKKDNSAEVDKLISELEAIEGMSKEYYDSVKDLKDTLSKKSVKESWEGEDIIDGLIETAKDLIEGGDSPEDAVAGAIDQQLIYTSDILALLEHYGSIDDSTILDSYYDDLYNDVYSGLDLDESLKEEKKVEEVKEEITEEKQEEEVKTEELVEEQKIEEEVVTEAPKTEYNKEESKEDALKNKVKSKLLSYIKKLGYDEKDFNEFFVVEVNKFTNDEGDTATHVQIRNDLVDFYDCEENGLISDLDEIVAPGYFEPYDAYIWDAYAWDFDESLKEEVEVSLDDANLDDVEEVEVKVEEPTVDEVDDEVVYFSAEEVKDVVEDVVDEIGEEMEEKEPEEVKVEEIIDEKIADAVEEKKEEESEDVEDDVSDLEDEEETVADFSADDMSEEDAQFFENLTISNNYKNEFKSEEQKKLDEELGEVVIKDNLGVEEDISEEDMNALLGD